MSRLLILVAVIPKGLKDGRLWLLQAVANPLLFGLFVGWLLIPENRGWHLAASLLGIVFIGATALLVHAGTLAYFAESKQAGPPAMAAAYALAVRHLAAFALCGAVVYLLWRSTDRLDAYQSTLPAYMRSMPALLRRHVSRAEVSGIYAALIFLVRWIISPGLLLPFAAAVAHSGFRGLDQGRLATWRAMGSGWYWLAIGVAALSGVLITTRLVAWKPFAHGADVGGESASLALRLLAAYLIGLTSWLVTCSMVGKRLQSALGTGGQTAP